MQMTTPPPTRIVKDLANRKLIIHRTFLGPIDLVWRAWTEKDLLEQWWAPKPFKAVTKSYDFREGGHWLYYMLGPDGSKMFACFNFHTIRPQREFTGDDFFCDEKGVRTDAFPGMAWKNEFRPVPDGTEVTVDVTFNSEEDLQRIVELGFEEGFTMAHGNLDELLAQHR